MTTEFKAGSPFVAEQPGSIGAGADIYRKLDRRPRRSKMMYAAPIIAGAIVLAGGAYMLLKPSGAPLSASPPAPQGLQTAPLAAPPAQPARMAAAPLPETQSLPAEPAPIAHHATRPAHLTAQRVRPRRGAASAVTNGEDASAYAPATHADPLSAAPQAATSAALPSAASSAPAPVTLPPPPAPPPS